MEMKHLKIKCYDCNKHIGYASIPLHIATDNAEDLNSLQWFDIKTVICCPDCETRRLTIYGEVK